MNSHAWGYLFMMIGILGLFIINISTNLMMTNEQDYFILREVTEAAMIDSIDYRAYGEGIGYDDVVHDNDSDSMYCLNGEKGQYRILKEKFVENFTYRFVNTVDMAKKYRIIVNEIVECPPKVTVTLLSSQGFDFIRMFTPTQLEDATLRNQITAIIETTGEEDEQVVIDSTENCEDMECEVGFVKEGCVCVAQQCNNPRTCPAGYTLSGCDTCLKTVKATFHGAGGTVLGSSVLRCVLNDKNDGHAPYCTTKTVVPSAKKNNYTFVEWDGPQNVAPGDKLVLTNNEDYYAVYSELEDTRVPATITCSNKTYNGHEQIGCTCSGGTIGGNYKATNVGTYTAKCTGDSYHTNATNKKWKIKERTEEDVVCSKNQYRNNSNNCVNCPSTHPYSVAGSVGINSCYRQATVVTPYTKAVCEKIYAEHHATCGTFYSREDVQCKNGEMILKKKWYSVDSCTEKNVHRVCSSSDNFDVIECDSYLDWNTDSWRRIEKAECERIGYDYGSCERVGQTGTKCYHGTMFMAHNGTMTGTCQVQKYTGPTPCIFGDEVITSCGNPEYSCKQDEIMSNSRCYHG